MRKVYVIVQDCGHEGYSEPLKAFDNENLANLYIEAVNKHTGGFKSVAMEVISLDDLEAEA